MGTLADIDRQQRFIAQQLGRYQWRYPLLGVVLGAAAASLAWRNIVWICVVTVLFMVSVLPLVGTPAKLGIVPRGDSRGSRLLVIVGCVVLLTTPLVATAGPWWTAPAAGAFILLFVTAFGRVRLAAERAELSRPPTGTTWWHRLIDRLAPSVLFAPGLAVVLGTATITLASDQLMVSAPALVAYLLGANLLQGVQTRIGEIPSERRPSRWWAFVPYLVLIFAPQAVMLPSWPNAWWPATGCGVVVACTVAVVGRWQRRMLRDPHLTSRRQGTPR